jgi:hypothetical protein
MTAFATDVWNAAFARVKKLPGFRTVRQNPVDTIQPEMLPLLEVVMLRDQRTADGNANTGEPRFFHRVSLGFEGIIEASEASEQLTKLDAAMNGIDVALLTDPVFVAMVEGFESADCKLVFGRIGETPTASYQMELVVSFRTVWPPERE